MRLPVLTLALLAAVPAAAEVRVATLVGDHMVLQQGRAVRLWGTADPGESVRAEVGGVAGATRADAGGHWTLTLPPLAASGPHTLTILGTNRLRFTDVWAGEVWLASGQSNMEWPLAQARDGAESAAAGCPGVRLFTVAKATAAEPRAAVEGTWQVCDAASAPAFSAVAFHFAVELSRALGVTVGLIHASWGGTPAESWTPRWALTAERSLKPMVDAFDAAMRAPATRAAAARALADWEARSFHQDTGNTGVGQGFAGPEADAAAWSQMDLPQYWETAGLKIDGAVWFRRVVDVPAEWAGRDLALSLGPVDDFDTTYWNGAVVGATGAETPQYWSAPRRYTVPARLVQPGRNVVAVRVFDHYGNGGFGGTPAQMKVERAGGTSAPLSLAGPWAYRIERSLEPRTVDFSTRPETLDSSNPNAPTVLWNAMLAPLTPFALAGAIWYQGESNASRAEQYRTLFPAMIRAWRQAWGQHDLAFLFVQLANYSPPGAPPGQSEWAALREAQASALSLYRTGMAVALDIGQPDDIHPRNKKEVGRRLALQALKTAYGQAVTASGPLLAGAVREGPTMRVRFRDADGLATSDGGEPRGFALAGSDRVWRWARARIEGETVVVWSDAVPQPVAVRYAWADDPPNTLRNQAGLSAPPFRTDEWSATAAPR